MNVPLLYILLLAFLILASALFSGTETAFMSLNRIRLRHMVDKKVPRANLVYRLIDDPGRLLSTLLIGNNIVNIATSSLATLVFISLLGPAYGVPAAMGVVTVLVLIFGEIVPKTWASQAPERWSFKAARTVAALMAALAPILAIFTALTRFTSRLLGHSNKPGKLVTEEEIRTVINLGQSEGVIPAREKSMLTGILEFSDTKAREVMVPRIDMFALGHDIPVKKAAELAVGPLYSRIPVYRDTTDHVVGVVHVKDLLAEMLKDPETTLEKIMRPALLVPDSVTISRLLETMQKQRASLAVLLDEYGATGGIVTIEDIVEEIVGEIEDEYDDEDEKPMESLDDRITLLDGSIPVDQVNLQLGSHFPEDHAGTIGGLLFSHLGRIPRPRDSVEFQGWELTVEKMEGRRISRVRAKKTS
jgi:CBS domain containing-hemolysin-like protein